MLASARPAVGTAPATRGSVLVVDDEYGVRSGLEQLLLMEGYRVAAAATGREALDWLAAERFDVALVDYRLPDVDGLTLLSSMRDMDAAPVTCMITAYANIDTAIAATRRGVDFFLPKPFSPDDLLGVVDTLLGHRRVRVEAERLRRANEANLFALASEQSQTRSLVASLRDAVLVVNNQGEVVLANHAMLGLLGKEDSEVLRVRMAEVLNEPAFSQLEALLSRSGEEAVVTEIEIEDRVYAASSVAYRNDADGPALGRILTLSDITPLRRLAVEKSRYVRTLVHEFRSPLGAIKSLLEVVLDRSLGDQLESYQPLLERADHRIDRLAGLVGALLSLSRADLERRPEEIQAHSELGAVARSVRDALYDQALRQSVSLTLEIPEGLPKVALAPDDLECVLVNLLSNAIKYNRPGGHAAILARSLPSGVRIEVVDTGHGIALNSLPHVFDEFFREKRDIARQVEGNGLGLAIVKRLVERAAGRVEVESTLGEGTRLIVVLPAA